MTNYEMRKAAGWLRTYAQEIRDGETVDGVWPANMWVAQRQHDELLDLANKLDDVCLS